MLFLLVFACTGAKESAATDDSGTPNESSPQESTPQESSPDDSGSAPTVSYATDVWPVLNSACSSCHTDDAYHPGLKMGTAEESYTTMLNDAPDQSGKGFDKYVVPGNPEASLFIDKMEKATPSYGGAQMPLDTNTWQPAPLSSAQLTTFRTWVEEGALNN